MSLVLPKNEIKHMINIFDIHTFNDIPDEITYDYTKSYEENLKKNGIDPDEFVEAYNELMASNILIALGFRPKRIIGGGKKTLLYTGMLIVTIGTLLPFILSSVGTVPGQAALQSSLNSCNNAPWYSFGSTHECNTIAADIQWGINQYNQANIGLAGGVCNLGLMLIQASRDDVFENVPNSIKARCSSVRAALVAAQEQYDRLSTEHNFKNNHPDVMAARVRVEDLTTQTERLCEQVNRQKHLTRVFHKALLARTIEILSEIVNKTFQEYAGIQAAQATAAVASLAAASQYQTYGITSVIGGVATIGASAVKGFSVGGPGGAVAGGLLGATGAFASFFTGRAGITQGRIQGTQVARQARLTIAPPPAAPTQPAIENVVRNVSQGQQRSAIQQRRGQLTTLESELVGLITTRNAMPANSSSRAGIQSEIARKHRQVQDLRTFLTSQGVTLPPAIEIPGMAPAITTGPAATGPAITTGPAATGPTPRSSTRSRGVHTLHHGTSGGGSTKDDLIGCLTFYLLLFDTPLRQVQIIEKYLKDISATTFNKEPLPKALLSLNNNTPKGGNRNATRRHKRKN